MIKDKNKPKCKSCGRSLRMHAQSGQYYCSDKECIFSGHLLPPYSDIRLISVISPRESETFEIDVLEPSLR